MQLIQEIKLDFNDVMLRPMTSSLNSRSEVNLVRTFKFKHSPKILNCVPIIAANMDTVGTIQMAKALQNHKMITALHKFYSPVEIITAINNGLDPKYLAFTTGIRPADFERLEKFGSHVGSPTQSSMRLADEIDIIMIDVPNGYIPNFFESCKRVRELFPEHIIMAGNIVTPDIAEHLIQNCGVDVVKVGIGPGAQCETRIMTGVGYPQLSAVIETANFAHGVHGHVISDGGCKTPGDVAKAFAGGADFVMLGTMLGGHDENESEIIEKDGQMFVKIYGMSSSEAMNKHYGGVEKHRASEGKTSLIPYKGSIEGTIQQILGGVRSAATYIGAANIKEMHKRATFVRLK